MIREERDVGFWSKVASHEAVAPHLLMSEDMDMGDIVGHPSITPLASEHGGFFFYRLDGLGLVYELHTLFTPEGWGREVAGAIKEALAIIFGQGGQVIVTCEVGGWWRSRPPKSHGWVPCGDFVRNNALGCDIKSWNLTKLAWFASPVGRKFCP